MRDDGRHRGPKDDPQPTPPSGSDDLERGRYAESGGEPGWDDRFEPGDDPGPGAFSIRAVERARLARPPGSGSIRPAGLPGAGSQGSASARGSAIGTAVRIADQRSPRQRRHRQRPRPVHQPPGPCRGRGRLLAHLVGPGLQRGGHRWHRPGVGRGRYEPGCPGRVAIGPTWPPSTWSRPCWPTDPNVMIWPSPKQ